MSARKVYFRLFIALLIYTTRVLNILPFGAAFLFMSYIVLFLWVIYPVVTGKKGTIVMPFQSDVNAQGGLIIFIIWLMTVLFRGIIFNYGLPFGAIEQLTNQHGIFAFLLPLALFLNPKQFNFKLIVKILTIVGFFFLFYVWYNRGFLFSSDHYTVSNPMMLTEEAIEEGRMWSSIVMYSTKLFSLMGFLMLLPSFIGKRLFWFVVFCWGVAFFCAAMGGRRGACVSLLLMAFISFYFYAYKGKNSAGWFKYFFILFVVLAIAYYVYSSYSGMFSIMANRIDADSRTEVIAGFLADMGEGFDWIWGRGLGGQYYCPFDQNGTFVFYRSAIENGFLYLILTGGVILLLLYVRVLLTAFRKGFFHTNNQLTKAFAAYIGLSLFNLIPFGLIECSITFFFIWVGVAICGSPYYRNMTDSEIRQLFK